MPRQDGRQAPISTRTLAHELHLSLQLPLTLGGDVADKRDWQRARALLYEALGRAS
jgi:hypothetical protein